MFEIHITTTPLNPTELEAFIEFCSVIGAKPIIIELEKGEVTQQPMISKLIKTDEVDMLHDQISMLKGKFEDAGFAVKRVKVEVPLEHIDLGKSAFPNYTGCYFEYHGKIRYEQAEDLQSLSKIYNLHISKNALKGEPNTRFITLRHFGCKEQFIDAAENYKRMLKNTGLTLVKEEYEYCIFDSNRSVDKGWLDTHEITE